MPRAGAVHHINRRHQDGSYTLTVSFLLGSDPDIDTVNVNNRVQTALAQLPSEVQLEG
jgi:HAE1 family hydrophobic/amphiphilic exporter-1